MVDISRLERALDKTPKLKDRLFSQAEQTLSVASLAARFAAKEALVKAIGNARGLSFLEVQVSKDGLGKPSFALSGESEATIKLSGVSKLHLSLSHDGGLAIAFVIAEGS